MAGNIKFTKEIVNERLKDKGVCITGEYINSLTKTEFMCTCGHEWAALPNNVIHKTGCPKCNGGIPFTIEALNEIKYSLQARGILMGKYINSSTKVEFNCEIGHIWKTTLQSVVNGTGCPHCSSRPPITADQVNEKLYERGIQLLSEYRNCHYKSEFTCSNGHRWFATPDNIVRKEQGCPQCYIDFTKSAYIYVLEIVGSDDEFTGFGISNRKNPRISCHSITLAKTNKNIVRQKLFDIPTRFAALAIENKLKISLPIYNSGISGFKTEATKLAFENVIHIVNTYILEKEQYA